jgi:hypothetical protein
MAQAESVLAGRATDAQVIAAGVLLAITLFLAVTGRKPGVASQDTEWTDAEGRESHC